MTEAVKVHSNLKKNDAKHETKQTTNKSSSPLSSDTQQDSLKPNDSKQELRSIMKQTPVECKTELKLNDLKKDLSSSLKRNDLKYESIGDKQSAVRQTDIKHTVKNDLCKQIKNIELDEFRKDLKTLLNRDVEKDLPPEKAAVVKKRLESMTDEEIIEENLREIVEKKSREERKANGRLIAVIVAFLVIFVSIYHVWIRRGGELAGALVPILIMLGYGGWVAILAKRDKRRRELFEKHLEEVAERNKAKLKEKHKLKKKKSESSLHYENEKGSEGGNGRRQRSRQCGSNSGPNRDLRVKRPSIRQKLFRQKANPRPMISVMPMAAAAAAFAAPTQVLQHANKKVLQRMDALAVPKPLVRVSSIP